MHCGTSHLQTVQENILSHIILATYRKFTVATVRSAQNVSHPRYQQVANGTSVILQQATKAAEFISNHCHIYAPITACVMFTPY